MNLVAQASSILLMFSLPAEIIEKYLQVSVASRETGKKNVVSSPRRFRAKIQSPTKLHVSWKEPKGQFDSYKVLYTTEPGGEQKDIEVLKQEAKLVIEDYDPSKEYNFKIIAVSGGQQSKPLQAKHEAQQSGVAMVQSQKRQDSGTREENNEISE
ncbi:hypothetical protein JOQ06_015519, partial [Pogonophryne albipinna]